ncbi:hypothetical protein GCK72_004113 [Caenorhabditis remanei]|uniref:Uncharacterized protein n=1 Tax=Caenorhabditis remanei TaxID=31234 RepID=A0A6A5HBC5_CAERE|nr:hypothetical protein GCK72_004113 [Caenorhabditis remanei]KAF1764166.1 hypothetical protein GCK72_004113 [Caenorhabditis remanei]
MTRPLSKPLFYETSRCVALYLKSTIRIQLYLRCPAFQTIHRTQNFRVADLKIRPEDFEIDGTVFQLGILRHYLSGNVPESTAWKNAAGGDRQDIDRYGLPILAQNGQQVPTDAQYIEQLEQQALMLERNGPRSSRALTEDDVKSHRMDIERKRLKIQSYELRMGNQKPPFQHFVELAMTCGEEKKCEYVSYEKTLQEIKDYVLHKIFAIDAKGFIGNLQIGDDAFNRYLARHLQNPPQLFQINPVFQAQIAAQNFLMPLPGLVPDVPPVFQEQPRVADVVPLLKLRAESVEVHRLVVTGNIENALASLKPFRCETPLKELKVSAQPYPDDPVLRTAQLLNIVSASRMIQIRNLQNSRIHFDQLVCDEQEFNAFVRMMEEAETMRYYSFEFSELKDLNFLVKRFRNLPGAERDDFAEIRSTNLPKRIVIPLINQKELNIYVEETSMEDTKYCDTPFIVKIKSNHILPIDQSVPMTTTYIATSHVDSCGYCVRETRRNVIKANSVCERERSIRRHVIKPVVRVSQNKYTLRRGQPGQSRRCMAPSPPTSLTLHKEQGSPVLYNLRHVIKTRLWEKRMTRPPSKQLFYETSKCVALYLKPIIRIQLYLRCPAFQTIHRAQNFRVADLKIRPEDFEIDGTVFQLGILRHYLFGNVPESTKLKNASGGDRHDIDRYGLPILPAQGQFGQQFLTDEQYIELLERQAFQMERDGPIASNRYMLTEDDVKSHRLAIERKRLKVRSYELRMRNQKPPFQQFVELAMTCGEEKKCEYVSYEKPLQEINTYVLHKIFRIDGKVIFGNLQIGKDGFVSGLAWVIQNPPQLFPNDPLLGAQLAEMDNPILLTGFMPEVPPVFQLQTRVADVVPLLKLRAESVEVHRLVVTGNLENALASLKPILAETPLRELKVSAQPFPDDPVVRTAEFFNIVGSSRVNEIQHLQNYRVHFDHLVGNEQEFYAFVRMMEEAETMRYYSFGFSELKDLNFSLKRFSTIPGAEREDFTEIRSTNFPKRIVIPLNNQKELTIYVEETSMEDTKYCNKPYIVKIKV